MNLQPLGDRRIVEDLEEEETTASAVGRRDTAKEKLQGWPALAVRAGPREVEGRYVRVDHEGDGGKIGRK